MSPTCSDARLTYANVNHRDAVMDSLTHGESSDYFDYLNTTSVVLVCRGFFLPASTRARAHKRANTRTQGNNKHSEVSVRTLDTAAAEGMPAGRLSDANFHDS